jgi:hypothetical protein
MPHDDMENPDAAGAKGDKGEIVVFMIRRETTCSECGCDLFSGNLLRLENEKALCLECADLDHLEFLPRGDTALTRRATKYTGLRAVVVQWARARKRYERQGILAEAEAIARAEAECEGDSELRKMRRAAAALRRSQQDQQFLEQFFQEIRLLYPRCPGKEARRIAEHACEKHSGRVGRSAAAKEFDPEAIRLAVVAYVRHVHTNYDRLLGMEIDRHEARAQVAGEIERVLQKWEERVQ